MKTQVEQEDHEFKASLGSTEWLFQKNKQKEVKIPKNILLSQRIPREPWFEMLTLKKKTKLYDFKIHVWNCLEI